MVAHIQGPGHDRIVAAMTRDDGVRRDRVTLLAWLAVGAIFAASLTLDPAYSVNGLYVGPVLLAMWSRHARLPYQIAAASTAAVTLSTVLLPLPPLPVAAVVFNRLLTMATFWLTAFVASRFRHSERGRLVDQSARAEAEDALRRSVKDLEDIKYALDQSAIVASTDVQGTITYANDKFCEISGYSRQELIGRNHRILNSGLHPIEFFREMYRTIGAGRVWRGEIRNRSKQGQYYWVDTTIVPLLDDRGHPVQYVAIRYDITERKRSEAAMREQTALAQVGKMAAVVAHEVRNPLAGIRGAMQVIGRRLAPDSAEHAIVAEVITRIDTLNNIVQDLLQFARPRTPVVAPVPVDALVNETVSLLKDDPKLSGVAIHVDADAVVVRADLELLKLALSNLVINSAQAMNGEGEIRITASSHDGWHELRVLDTGPGIPPDIRERLFEPFFTTKHRGTGLGLPTARRIIEAHGGTLTLDCPPTGGTIATIRLPA
jgi:PAS domain S-box-containing protein